MTKPLFIFRIILVLSTATFMAFHVQVFIARIEPNVIFSWMAAIIVEGFIVSLALQKTVVSRILLIPLFLISVIAASASFIVQNERLLDEFFTQKRVIEQIKIDIAETQRAYEFGERYITRTLQRERALRDELREIMQGKTGDITLYNSLIFLILVLVMQTVSIYTAMSLKDEILLKQVIVKQADTKFVSEPETLKQAESFTETGTLGTELGTERGTLGTEHEKDKSSLDRDNIVVELKKLKSRMSFTEMSRMFGIPKTTLSRVISTNGEGISDEIFKKISEKL